MKFFFVLGKDFVDKETKSKVIEVWEKMSKSRYNGVSPADVFKTYGSDLTRLLIVDNVSPREHRNWKTDGTEFCFLQKIPCILG